MLTNLVFSHPYSNSNADELTWGSNVGPVSAYVDQTDHANGLTIRASPSADSQTVGYIPSGTKIRGSSEFKSGWVKLISPVDTGWVNIGFLKARPLEGTVTKVDNTELCLPIRAGPAASQQKVGCGQIGEVVNLTGIMTTDNWLQLTDRRGWVDASSDSVANRDTPGGRGQCGDSKRNFGRTGRKSISRKAYNKASAGGKRPKKGIGTPEGACNASSGFHSFHTDHNPTVQGGAGQGKATSHHLSRWMVCCFRYWSGDT